MVAILPSLHTFFNDRLTGRKFLPVGFAGKKFFGGMFAMKRKNVLVACFLTAVMTVCLFAVSVSANTVESEVRYVGDGVLEFELVGLVPGEMAMLSMSQPDGSFSELMVTVPENGVLSGSMAVMPLYTDDGYVIAENDEFWLYVESGYFFDFFPVRTHFLLTFYSASEFSGDWFARTPNAALTHSVAVPPTPFRPGYVFTGWGNMAPDATHTPVITRDAWLFAQWEPGGSTGFICDDCNEYPCVCNVFGPVPHTGTPAMSWTLYAMFAFAALSAGFWVFLLLPKRRK